LTFEAVNFCRFPLFVNRFAPPFLPKMQNQNPLPGQTTRLPLDTMRSNELIHPDDPPILSESYKQLASGEVEVFKCEYRAKHKNGSRLVMEGCARPITATKSSANTACSSIRAASPGAAQSGMEALR
jgi:hypothetical protein